MENKKRVITVIAICVVVICAIFTISYFIYKDLNSEKRFEKAGLSIVLTNNFTEGEHVEYTAYYSSNEIIVLTLKSEFYLFDEDEWASGNKTVEEYAQKILLEYEKIYDQVSEIVIDNNLIYFNFNFTGNGKEFKYIVAVYKAEDAFWSVLLGCNEKNYNNLSQTMFKYASSVKV